MDIAEGNRQYPGNAPVEWRSIMLVRRLIVAAVFFVAVVVGGAGPQSPLSLETPHLAEAANTRTWTGGGANSNWTNAANWGGTAPVAGDELRFPSGAMRMSNTNDFPAGTSFDQI